MYLFFAAVPSGVLLSVHLESHVWSKRVNSLVGWAFRLGLGHGWVGLSLGLVSWAWLVPGVCFFGWLQYVVHSVDALGMRL